MKLGVLGVLFVLLSGCTDTASPPSQTPSVRASATGAATATSKATHNVFHGTRAEQAAAHAQCMRDAGWPVEMGPDGRSYSIGNPPEQADQVAADGAKCIEQIGTLDQGFGDPANRRVYYDFNVERRACLEQAGWAMNPAPSFQSFDDAFVTNGAFDWNPINQVPPMDMEKAKVACPDTDKF